MASGSKTKDGLLNARPRRFTRKDYKLFPDGFWSAPEKDRNKPGDQDHDMIFLAVGRALSIWEGLEISINSLFMVMCTEGDDGNSRYLQKTFGSIENTIGRLRTLKVVAEMVLRQILGLA